MFPYKPKIKAKAIDWPAVMPEGAGAWKVGAAPEFAVKTCPAVPAAVVANALVVAA